MLGRIQIYIFIAIALVGGYFYWKHQVEQQALMEYNQRQLEQALKDREEFQQKMSEIENKQRNVEENLAKQNDEVAQKLTNIDNYLLSPEVNKQDKQSSEVLKNTITELSGKKRK